MILATLVILLALPKDSDDIVFSFESALGGDAFVYEIRESRLKSVPKWEPNASSPPLSPGDAIKIGNNGLKMLEKRGFFERKPESNEWELIEASLVPIGGQEWLWKLRFEEIPGKGKGLSGITGEATVVVLMDGKILVPSRVPNEVNLRNDRSKR